MSLDTIEKVRMSLDQFMIEGTHETAEFERFLKTLKYGGQGLKNASFARHDRFLRQFLPRILAAGCYPSQVIDLGYGSGAITHALSHVTKSVTGFDIGLRAWEIANERKKIYGLSNIEFKLVDEDSSYSSLIELRKDATLFCLHAVLEHMTEAERLNTLSTIWRAMGRGDFLWIGNTPNRLVYEDLHTYETSFVHLLPDLTCLEYLKIRPEIRFSARFQSQFEKGGLGAFSLDRIRRGLGVSYHDFLIAFQGISLDECTACSDVTFPSRLSEAVLALYMQHFAPEIPQCFYVRDLNFLIRKPRNEKEASEYREKNENIRKKSWKKVGNFIADAASLTDR